MPAANDGKKVDPYELPHCEFCGIILPLDPMDHDPDDPYCSEECRDAAGLEDIDLEDDDTDEED